MKVGILFSPLLKKKKLGQLLNLVQGQETYPTLVLAEEKSNCDCLVITDGLGIPGDFKHQKGIWPSPVCPMMERFLASERGLKYYIQREIPIILMGTSRAIWYEIKGVEYKIINGQLIVQKAVKVEDNEFILCNTEADLIININRIKRELDDFKEYSRIHSGQADVDSKREENRKTPQRII